MRWLATALLVLFWLSGCVSETTRLERRFQKNPTDAETLYQLGLAYRSAGRLLESARTLDRASALAPDHPFALNEAGVSYALAGRPDLAVDRLEHQIRLNDDPLSHSSLGSIYSDLLDYEKAEAELRQAIAGGLTYDGNFLLALLRFRQFRPDDARAAIDAIRPNRVPSALYGGHPPEFLGGRSISDLKSLIALDEAAQRVAGKRFSPPLVVPPSSLEERAELMKIVHGRICCLKVEGDAWKVYDVIVTNASGGVEIPRENSEGYLVESIHEFHFRPTSRTADKGKFYIRKFLQGQGRPPCWCMWNLQTCL